MGPDLVAPWGKASAVAEWSRWWQSLGADCERAGPALRLAARQGFVLTRDQLRGCGQGEAAIRRGLRRGTLWSPRRGILAVAAVPEPEPDDVPGRRLAERRRAALAATAAALANQGHVVSGRSAAILAGLPLFREPDQPQLTAAVPVTMGHRGGLLARPATLSPAELDHWFGAPVTKLPRTLVDLARHDRWDGIIAADAALREGLASRREIERALARASGWPGVRRARTTLLLADPRAESPLESLTRLRLHYSGLPMPEPQVWIRVGADRFRVDLCWQARRLILEADGRVKYAEGSRWQQAAAVEADGRKYREDDPLWLEKVREEYLSRAGYRVLRVMWDDIVHDWPATQERIRAALSASPTA
jgi:very-short-patch-repair endonuclease